MAFLNKGLGAFLASVAFVGLVASPAGAVDAPETLVAASAYEFAVAEAACPTGMVVQDIRFAVSAVFSCCQFASRARVCLALLIPPFPCHFSVCSTGVAVFL
jgi:hypothetical protein